MAKPICSICQKVIYKKDGWGMSEKMKTGKVSFFHLICKKEEGNRALELLKEGIYG